MNIDPRPYLSSLSLNVYFSEFFTDKYDYKESKLYYGGYKKGVSLKPSIAEKGHLRWEISTDQMVKDYGKPYEIEPIHSSWKKQFSVDIILKNL
jgi:hypothetical protein